MIANRAETLHGVAVLPLAPDVRTGTQVAGYQLESLIGRGGMGVVYRAEQIQLQRIVAIKLFVPELGGGDAFRERFVREAQLAAAVHHPSIVTVYDAGEADGLLYIAMQYVEGSDLATLLARDGPLDPGRALAILAPVADALDAAHALGIVHRDVKPGNVLVDARGSYLGDFGLTRRIAAESGLTVRGQFVGTIDYMAPEQIEGKAVDARGDVYALGCVLYHALTGSVPFEKDSQVAVLNAHLHEVPEPLATRRPGLPGELDAVIATALAKRKDERYASCGALIAAAHAAIGGDSQPQRTISPRPLARTHRVLVVGADPALRALVRVSLATERFAVTGAHGVAEAIDLAHTERPSVVLVDWSLAGSSAADLCRALRAEPSTAPATIIAVTARSDALDEEAILAAGADDVIAKPFSSLQLLLKLGELLGEELLQQA